MTLCRPYYIENVRRLLYKCSYKYNVIMCCRTAAIIYMLHNTVLSCSEKITLLFSGIFLQVDSNSKPQFLLLKAILVQHTLNPKIKLSCSDEINQVAKTKIIYLHICLVKSDSKSCSICDLHVTETLFRKKELCHLRRTGPYGQ